MQVVAVAVVAEDTSRLIDPMKGISRSIVMVLGMKMDKASVIIMMEARSCVGVRV